MFVIAGATGHVGGVAAKLLLQMGKKVRAVVRSEEKGAQLKAAGAELAVGELGDEAFLAGALRGAEGAFLLLPAPAGAPESAAAFYAFQRTLGQAIANAVKAGQAPHVVLLSSVGAHVAEGNGPIKGLHHLERALEQTGAKLTFLRPCYFMENLGGLIEAARNGAYPAFFDPSFKQPMVATRDIGDAVAQLIVEAPPANQVVNLIGPQDYSAEECATIFGRLVGRPVQVIPVPPEGTLAALGQAMPPAWAEVYAEMYDGFRKGLGYPPGEEVARGITTLPEVLAPLVRG